MADPNEGKVIAGLDRYLSAIHVTISSSSNWCLLRIGSDDEAAAVLGSASRLPKLTVIRNMPCGGRTASGDLHSNHDSGVSSSHYRV